MNPFMNYTDWPNQASSQAMANAVDPEEARAIVRELAKVILRERHGGRCPAARPELRSLSEPDQDLPEVSEAPEQSIGTTP